MALVAGSVFSTMDTAELPREGVQTKGLRIRLVHGDLDGTPLIQEVASRVDCIVNSANNHLLSRGCTGIAGALVEAGGPEILKASDEAKARAGGNVPVGTAVWSTGGRLRCGIVHAVALAYRPKVLATPESVRTSFASALCVAGSVGCRTAVVKLMCARPGYSIVPPEKAKAAMLEAMIAGAEGIQRGAEHGCLEEVLIFVPPDLFRPMQGCQKGFSKIRVLFTDSGIGVKMPLLKSLEQLGAEVIWRENIANAVVVDEVFAEDVDLIVTNQRREPDGDKAGLMLLRTLSERGFAGRCILYTSRLDDGVLVEAWLAGACFATDDIAQAADFLHSCIRFDLSARLAEKSS